MPAFAIVKPPGWALAGGVSWAMECPLLPALIAFRITSPDGQCEVQMYPTIVCEWGGGGGNLLGGLLGRLMGGSKADAKGSIPKHNGAELRAPLPAADAMKQILVPRYFAAMPGSDAITIEQAPDYLAMCAQFVPGQPQPANSQAVRGRFQSDGKTHEVMCSTLYLPTPMGVTNWAVCFVFRIAAPAPVFDRLVGPLRQITASFRINPQWQAHTESVGAQMIQRGMENVRSAGRLSQTISANNDAMLQHIEQQRIAGNQMLDHMNRQSAAADASFGKFSDAMLGIERYDDPYTGQTAELPTGSDYAWANAFGEHQGTDSPSYDPNLGSTVEWKQMQKHQ